MAYIDKIKIGDTTHTLALTPSKGSATIPVYFDANGLPQACTSLSLNTSGSAGSVAWGNVSGKPSSYTPSSHASTATTYGVGDESHYGHVILYPAASCTTFTSDSGGACTPAAVKKAVSLFTNDYAPKKDGTGASGTWGINITGSATKATQDQNGHNLYEQYNKRHRYTVNLTGYNANTWYPVLSTIATGGLRRIACVCQLNTGSVPSWSSHSAGFTAVVEMLATACGWGTTGAYSICLANDQRFVTDTNNPPIGYRQWTNSSNACFWCRGGGIYIFETDYATSWTVYSSSTSIASETIGPTTTYPGINFAKSRIYANLSGDSIYGAVWNDYAEFRGQKETVKPGYCVASADNGKVYKTTEKLQACDGIVSDTFGFAIGETDECKTPLAVAGRVLAYCEGDRNNYHAGDTVCAGPDGKIVKMTREEIREWPDRIVGVVSEIPEYETWGTGNVKVDGRIWIKIK